jgi:tyrosine-protein kinase Etk/Wzc
VRAEPQISPRLTSTYASPIRKYARIAIVAIASALVAILVSLLLIPKTYRAEARILPNLSSSGSSSLMALAAGTGIGDFLSGQLGAAENPILTYPEILASRTLLERTLASPAQETNSRDRTILAALGAQGPSHRQTVENGVRILRDLVDVRANPRTGLIVITAVTRDSVLSASIVDRMLRELNAFNVETRSSRGRATREFVEGRLGEAKREMTQAEVSLASFRGNNLRIGNAPRLELEENRLQREVLVRSELYQLLARQYEMARIEEKRDTPTFSVIDPASPPVRKHGPRTTANALAAMFAAIVLQVAYEYWRRRKDRLQVLTPVSSSI